MKDFSANLRRFRKRKKLTQEELAGRIGVIRATYWAYEKGSIMPPYDKLEQLADIFGITIDELMGREVDRTDISDDLSRLLRKLEKEDQLYEGRLLDGQSRELLIASLENSIRLLNIMKGSDDSDSRI